MLWLKNHVPDIDEDAAATPLQQQAGDIDQTSVPGLTDVGIKNAQVSFRMSWNHAALQQAVHDGTSD
jgi:hypothetical protein